jgi:hypothetical protein
MQGFEEKRLTSTLHLGIWDFSGRGGRKKGKRVTKGSGICGSERHKGVEKGDKAFWKVLLIYLFEGTSHNEKNEQADKQEATGPNRTTMMTKATTTKQMQRKAKRTTCRWRPIFERPTARK